VAHLRVSLRLDTDLLRESRDFCHSRLPFPHTSRIIAANRNAFSIGEQIAIALVLDRADWLKELGWTILGAIDYLGGQWFRAAQRAWLIHSERE